MSDDYVSANELLAEYFEDIYFNLHKKGVPDARMPSPELILSMIMDKFLLEDELDDWVTDYAEIHYDPLTSEYVEAVDKGVGHLKPTALKKQRPPWLKVLDSSEEVVMPVTSEKPPEVRVPDKEMASNLDTDEDSE